MSRYDHSPLDGKGVGSIRDVQGLLSSGRLRSGEYQNVRSLSATHAIAAYPEVEGVILALGGSTVDVIDRLGVSLGALHRIALINQVSQKKFRSYIDLNNALSRSIMTLAEVINSSTRDVEKWQLIVPLMDDKFLLTVVLDYQVEQDDIDAIAQVLNKVSVGTFAFYSALDCSVEQMHVLADEDVDPQIVAEMIRAEHK